MKRVLIVSPNWPPVSYPDLHRVRMGLPFFAEFGWEPLILKIDPAEQQGIKDPGLAQAVPAELKVWQAGALPRQLTGWAGVNSVGLRSFAYLAHLGERIIREVRPAVAFFSTTMFPVMTLGRFWYHRHRLPYVLDFQDPWVSDRTSDSAYKNTHKGRVMGAIDTLLEPFALRRASHIISVSPAYPGMLMRRYSWLREDQFTVLPFGAAERDFAHLARSALRQTVFDPLDGKRHWVYVGRGGDDMAFAVRILMLALAKARSLNPASIQDLRLHFIGTDYAPDGQSRKTIEPVAAEYSVADLVQERTGRIPYFEALACLRDAHALVVIGSGHAGYTASKIFPYILAQKPLLVVCHRDSSMVQIIATTGSGIAITYDEDSDAEAVAAQLCTDWIDGACERIPATDWKAFEPFSAREMTRRLCRVFDEACAG